MVLSSDMQERGLSVIRVGMIWREILAPQDFTMRIIT